MKKKILLPVTHQMNWISRYFSAPTPPIEQPNPIELGEIDVWVKMMNRFEQKVLNKSHKGKSKPSLERFLLDNLDIFQVVTADCQRRLSLTSSSLYYLCWTHGFTTFTFPSQFTNETQVAKYLARKPRLLYLNLKNLRHESEHISYQSCPNFPQYLGKLECLHTIVLNRHALTTERTIEAILCLTTLRSLIYDNASSSCSDIREETFQQIMKGLTRLHTLEIRNFPISTKNVFWMSKHPNLAEIRIIQPKFGSGHRISGLSALTNLVELDIKDTLFTLNESDFKALFGFEKLRRLDFHSANDQMLRLGSLTMEKLSNLEILNVEGCAWFTVAHLRTLPVDTLTSLKMGGTSIGDDGIRYVGRFTNLRYLQIPSHTVSYDERPFDTLTKLTCFHS